MSRISKMSIQGIRSFGPEDRDKGVINFFSPLTLIVGPNGTGKTTIIECLKYITTGEMPPGGKAGAAFINDPKIAQETEVKAQVSLQFYDMKGEQCTAKRSLVATQKRNKVEMKTLEGLIVRKLSNGEKAQISNKCAEMDREMISLLGVSKPILENVIFCHQEESNWPLSEGRALKQKFDDIFASTRYVKALDAIRKCTQDQKTLVKEYKIELKYLTQNKEKVEQMTKKISELSVRREASCDGISKVESKLVPIIEKLKTMEEKEDEIRTISNIIAKLDGERNQMKRIVIDLRGKIKNIYSGSIHDLMEEVADFENKIREKERSLTLNKERQKALGADAGLLEKEREKVLTETVRLEQDEQRNHSYVSRLNKKMKEAVSSHQLRVGGAEDPRVEEVVESMRGKSESFVAERKLKKENFSDGARRLQKDLDEKRSIRTKLSTEQKMKEETLRRNLNEVEQINKKLELMDLSASELDNLKFAINNMEDKLGDHKKHFDAEEERSCVQQLQKETAALDATIRSLDSELSALNQDLAVRTQLEIFGKDKTVKEESVRRLQAKNGDTFKHLLGSMPNEYVGRSLDKYLVTQSRKVRVTTENLQQLKNSLTKLETRRKIEQENLIKKQEEVRGYEQKISNVTHGKDVQEGLNDLTSKLQTNQDKKGHLAAMDYMFKKYIEKLRREHPDCPLCHRPFDEQSEVEELITEMESKLTVIPERLDTCQKLISETNAEYEKWLQLNPIKNMMETCRGKDVPRIETSVNSLNSEISVLTSQISEKEEEYEVDHNDEGVARSLTSDAAQMDRLQTEINELVKKISLHSAKLSSVSTGRSIEDVQNEKSSRIDTRDSLSHQLDQKQSRLEDFSSKMHGMQDELHRLKSKQLKIEGDLQSKIKLDSTKTSLISTNESLLSEIQIVKENVEPLAAQISEIVRKMQSMERQNDEEVEEISARLNRVNEDLKELTAIQSEINKYERNDCGGRLRSCRDNLKSLEVKTKEMNEKKSKLAATVEQLNQDITDQMILLREMEDNKQLFEKQNEIKEFERSIRVEQEKLGSCSVDELMREKQSLKKEKEKFYAEMEIFKTRKQKLAGEIGALQEELSSDSLVDAEKKYMNKMIAVKTTELASSDLEKYYKALDRTIMSYHNQKMAEINKIIRELWRNTYKGHDIETIEIRSDEEEGSGAAKARRTYHYRVVMVSGSVELDMRGRCSAGQKVLASLIIRLALAETFCLNCGVLALDEPTTNLDRENIESLAFALVEIIKSRSRQKNFQLIVITHDEDFVDLLGRSDYVDEFFRVKKDDIHGCSRLMRCKIQSLQTK